MKNIQKSNYGLMDQEAVVYIQMEYDADIKKNNILWFSVTWMEQENFIMLSEGQKKRDAEWSFSNVP